MNQSLDFSPEEFAVRRARVFDEIGLDAGALVAGAPALGAYALFRQTNEFFYLCGVEAPGAYLLLNGAERLTTLFVPDPDALASGHGVDAVLPVSALSETLKTAKILFTPYAPAENVFAARDALVWANARTASDPWDGQLSRETRLAALLRTRFPRLEVRDLSPILDDMRLIKSGAEITLMRRAGKLSARAVTEAMKRTRSGLRENDLHAIALYLYQAAGARGEGYRAILPSGTERIWDIHYFDNNGILEEGDLVLMDTAPDVGYYTSDIGRMWPVDGKYDALQRELYGFMVTFHKQLLARIRPGVTAEQVLNEASTATLPLLEQTQFSKPIYEAAARKVLTFKGSLSHPVGMAVHDVGDYWQGVLRPGMVFTVDPQMWVPEEKLYIRVEDTVLVTKTGVEVLTADAPLDLDDVEATMRQPSAFDAIVLEGLPA
jgi:Xaa-Pro aminopeptidase